MIDEQTDRERLRNGFAATPDEAVASADCPSDETIWKAVQGELDTPAMEKVLDHATSCAACAESWRMARSIGDSAGVCRKATLHAFPSRRRMLMLGAAAATILLAFLVVPTLNEQSAPPVEFRDPTGVNIESLLDETVAVTRERLVLRWTGGPAGTLYSVDLADENLNVLVRSEQQETTEYAVPQDVLDGVESGSTLYWRIEAVLPDTTRVSSGVYLLRLE